MNIGGPLENFPTNNAIEDTRRLTAQLEEYIQLCPEQYFWIHRRFKGRPEPHPNPYQTKNDYETHAKKWVIPKILEPKLLAGVADISKHKKSYASSIAMAD